MQPNERDLLGAEAKSMCAWPGL